MTIKIIGFYTIYIYCYLWGKTVPHLKNSRLVRTASPFKYFLILLLPILYFPFIGAIVDAYLSNSNSDLGRIYLQLLILPSIIFISTILNIFNLIFAMLVPNFNILFKSYIETVSNISTFFALTGLLAILPITKLWDLVIGSDSASYTNPLISSAVLAVAGLCAGSIVAPLATISKIPNQIRKRNKNTISIAFLQLLNMIIWFFSITCKWPYHFIESIHKSLYPTARELIIKYFPNFEEYPEEITAYFVDLEKSFDNSLYHIGIPTIVFILIFTALFINSTKFVSTFEHTLDEIPELRSRKNLSLRDIAQLL